MKNKILFISYVFPPTGGAGIQRTVKLVKYFQRLNWDVSVLTAKNPSVPVFDYEMLKDIPKEVKIFKSTSLEIPYALKRRLWGGAVKSSENKVNETENVTPKEGLKSRIIGFVKFFVHLIMMPDPQIGWNFFTLRKARKIIKKNGINYVFISAPPFSSLLLVPGLKKTGAKIVADFRDEWTEFYLKSYDFHQRDEYTTNKIIKMEQDVVEAADLITMATNSFVSNYQQKYQQHAHKIKILTNGFDAEDFKDKVADNKNTEKFKITYTGTIFNVTTARYLLAAIDKLFTANPELKDKLGLTIVGRVTDDEKVHFDEFRHKEQLNLAGYVPHEQSVSYLFNSDLLVVIVDELDGSDRIIAAKVFEYIYTGVPILALVPENGEIAKIVKSTETGLVVSNRDVEQIFDSLSKFINKEFAFARNEDEINKYSRENIARQLMNYLMDV